MRDTRLVEAVLRSIDTFNDALPTLLLSEVVLTYMAINSCNNIIKWIGETFQNSILAVYEQINPIDAFGQVMCNHFIKLGSPLKCILRYPTLKSQVERHLQLGLDDCKGVKIIDYYKDRIPDEDKHYINHIEPFDEFEEWQLKCSHYALIMGSKGQACKELVENLIGNSCQLVDNNHSLKSVEITITEFPLVFGSRFGHSLCVDEKNEKLYIIGGFGESFNEKGRHRRLNSVEVISVKTLNFEIIDYIVDVLHDRIHVASCLFDDLNILVMYGRGSPDKPFDLVSIDISEERLKCEKFELIETKPKLRWRHGSCKLNDSQVIIYGGRSYNGENNQYEVLNDLHVLSNKSRECKRVNIDENVCKPRHSHNLCKWNNKIIVSGGLDKHENVLHEVLVIDSETFQVEELKLKNGFVLPRYSHTSHVVDNFILLVGGVNHNEKSPGLCIIDMVNLTAYEFELPVKSFDDSPLMLQNHQTYLLNKNSILVIGGGGNCFSFGTHINKKPVVLNIKNCWKTLEQE